MQPSYSYVSRRVRQTIPQIQTRQRLNMLSKILSETQNCEECDLEAENRVILDGGDERLLCGAHADEVIENQPMEIKMIQSLSIWG